MLKPLKLLYRRLVAIKLKEKGAKLILYDDDANDVKETLSLCGNNKEHITFDETYNEEALKLVVAKIKDLRRPEPPLDCIVNCSSLNPVPYQLETLSEDFIQAIVDKNLKAILFLYKTWCPCIAPRGSFVNIHSINGDLVSKGIYHHINSAARDMLSSMEEPLREKDIRMILVQRAYEDSKIVEDVEKTDEKVASRVIVALELEYPQLQFNAVNVVENFEKWLEQH